MMGALVTSATRWAADLSRAVARTPLGRVLTLDRSENAGCSCVYAGARVLSGFRTVRYWREEGAVVLYYHEVEPRRFETHLEFISSRWNIVSLDTLCERIEAGKDISNSVVITFDDGFKSNVDLLPAIQKYSAPVTLYLVSGVVGTDGELWPATVDGLRAIAAATKVKAPVVRDCSYYLSIPDRQKNEEISRAVAQLQYSPQGRTALSLPEIDRMVRSGLVTVGSHSKSHPCLSMTTDDDAWEEISGSKRDLEAKLGVSVRHFSYPHEGFRDKHVSMVKRAGYASGATTIPELNTANTDLFKLRRIWVGPEWSRWTLACYLSGLGDRLGISGHEKARLRARGVQF
jgi:peptidoglycan/xylan/chitin deacetylase (PgdA/CDA1 family)